MGLALAVLILLAFGLGYYLGRARGAVRGLERLGEAEFRNRRRMTGL
jgi:hypothetical protein